MSERNLYILLNIKKIEDVFWKYKPYIIHPCSLFFGVFWVGLFLSIFRDMFGDEVLHLREAAVMADCIRKGQWFGNEAVGTHGFLLKLPVALLFLVFGNSVFVATVFNIVLAALSGVLCFFLLKQLLKHELWAFGGALLFVTNYNFIQGLPTFMRDIPAAFAFLVFLLLFLQRANKWLLGFALLLALDAKEYIFYLLVPAVALWAFCDSWFQQTERNIPAFLRESCERCIAYFLPAFTWLVLMFCTSAIPLNNWNAMVFGFIEGGSKYMVNHFVNIDTMKYNLAKVGYEVEQFTVYQQLEAVASGLSSKSETSAGASFVDVFMKALGQSVSAIGVFVSKILYPRTFSLIATPKILILPALLMSFLAFKQWFKQRKTLYMGLCFMLWVYLTVYLLRVSHGRYLIPLTPVIIFFFLLFVRDQLGKSLWSAGVLLVAGLFMVMGFTFEVKFIAIKVLLNLMLFAVLVYEFYALYINKETRRTASALFIMLLGLFSFSIAIFSSLLMSRNGQLNAYFKHGYLRETDKVVKALDPGARILIEGSGNPSLYAFYRNERPYTPEWRWSLHASVPKHDLVNHYTNAVTFFDTWKTEEDLYRIVDEKQIEVLVVLAQQEILREAMKENPESVFINAIPWLCLREVRRLRHQDVYIYDIGPLPQFKRACKF